TPTAISTTLPWRRGPRGCGELCRTHSASACSTPRWPCCQVSFRKNASSPLGGEVLRRSRRGGDSAASADRQDLPGREVVPIPGDRQREALGQPHPRPPAEQPASVVEGLARHDRLDAVLVQ